MAYIESGQLNKPVKLRTQASSRDAAGGPVVTPTIGSRYHWAAIKPMNGREFERLGVQVAEVTHVIRMRHFGETAAMKPKDSILFESRVFEIVSIVNPDEARVAIDFLCREVVN